MFHIGIEGRAVHGAIQEHGGGPTNLRVQRADFMKAPLSEAALVVCYLGPKGTQAVKAKLEAESQARMSGALSYLRHPGVDPGHGTDGGGHLPLAGVPLSYLERVGAHLSRAR